MLIHTQSSFHLSRVVRIAHAQTRWIGDPPSVSFACGGRGSNFTRNAHLQTISFTHMQRLADHKHHEPNKLRAMFNLRAMSNSALPDGVHYDERTSLSHWRSGRSLHGHLSDGTRGSCRLARSWQQSFSNRSLRSGPLPRRQRILHTWKNLPP